MDAADLSPETCLQLAPNVRTRFDAAGHVLVDAPDGTSVDIGPRGYAILSLFARPLALGDAIDRLENGRPNSTDFAPALSVVNMLMEEGALVRPGTRAGVPSGWADPVEHARMLHDERRTGDYVEALTQAVRPGDVVLDLGTGSGVLAIAAARAGARHVYAVEASDIAGVAERVFATNARLIPYALTLFARPLRLPETEARQRALGRAAVKRWRGLYEIDFEPLVDAVAPGPVNSPTEAEVAATWPVVGRATVIAVLHLSAFDGATVSACGDLVLDTPGAVNAVAVTFRAHLYEGIAHTLDPWRWPTSSWATSVWVLPDPLVVGADAALRVRYSRRVRGAPDGLTCEIVERS